MQQQSLPRILCSFVLLFSAFSQEANAEGNSGSQDFSFAFRSPQPTTGAGGGVGPLISLPFANATFEVNTSATCAWLPSNTPHKHTVTVTVLDTAVDDIKNTGKTRYKKAVTTYDNIATIMTGPMVGYWRPDESSVLIDCFSQPNDTLAYIEALGFGHAKELPAGQTFEKLPGDQDPALVPSPRSGH